MKKSISSNEYQKAIILLIREKYPSLLLGCLICAFFLFSVKGIWKTEVKSNDIKKEARQVHSLGQIRTYTVQAGDDLWGIAQKVYGSGFNAYDIAQANKLEEPYTLTQNQILIIPKAQPKKSTQGEITNNAPSTRKISEYVVKQGEYLWQIAEKIYGDGNQMSKLIDANRLPYPYNVEEGQKLIVP